MSFLMNYLKIQFLYIKIKILNINNFYLHLFNTEVYVKFEIFS